MPATESAGEVPYLVSDRDCNLVMQTDDLSAGLSRLHKMRDGSFIVREDGAVLAFMAGENYRRMKEKLPSPKLRQLLLQAGLRRHSQ